MAPVERPPIEVTLVFAAATHQIETETLRLPHGAAVADACAASKLWRRLVLAPGLGPQTGPQTSLQIDLQLGLWGRLCGPDAPLQAGDRLELLRPLQADPMEARRQRLRRDGLRKVQRAPRKPPRQA